MPIRPQGYREPNDKEMVCRPEGTLICADVKWEKSGLIGAPIPLGSRSLYAVPINEVEVPKENPEKIEQVGKSNLLTQATKTPITRQAVRYCRQSIPKAHWLSHMEHICKAFEEENVALLTNAKRLADACQTLVDTCDKGEPLKLIELISKANEGARKALDLYYADKNINALRKSLKL